MQRTQFSLLQNVLKRLEDHELLDHMVIIGSWCIYLYKEYFKNKNFTTTIRTRDVDLLILIPVRIGRKVDFFEIIEDLGFIRVFKGDEGYTTFQHPDLIIEFLIEERGKGNFKPVIIKELGVLPQAERYLNILSSNLIKLEFNGIGVPVPHPANFALHKILISHRRKVKSKADMDKRQGIKLLHDLIQNGNVNEIKSLFNKMPKGWQKTIKKELKGSNEDEILRRIES